MEKSLVRQMCFPFSMRESHSKDIEDYVSNLEKSIEEEQASEEYVYLKINPVFFKKYLKKSRELFPSIIRNMRNSAYHGACIESGDYKIELPFLIPFGLIYKQNEFICTARGSQEGGLRFVNLIGRRGLNRIFNMDSLYDVISLV